MARENLNSEKQSKPASVNSGQAGEFLSFRCEAAARTDGNESTTLTNWPHMSAQSFLPPPPFSLSRTRRGRRAIPAASTDAPATAVALPSSREVIDLA
jgi:hypothetical protein